MKKLVMFLVVGVLSVANVVSADFVQGIDIDFVTIGNPGNAGDTSGYGLPLASGAVDYEYQIGKYEITNGQWNTFVSAAGAPTGNPVGAYDESSSYTGTNVPANKVSWYEAAQFCNYLTTGDKSLGAYQFSGNNTNPGDFIGIDRDTAVSTYGMVYVIPTQDEWFKAAYYTGSGYSRYANGKNYAPYAGYDTNYDWAIYHPWNVGTGTMEQNGTFDMMGNVSEWLENLATSITRGCRGGMFGSNINDSISSGDWDRSFPYSEYDSRGVRIAAVPEPCSVVLFGLGNLLLRKRRA